ncbi:Rha family transcriptional regulator [Shewanella chilikensis]|uniref:phage antirepressor KilAC domain-containing protein n=1 Tax=Shewanella chilikensis TaxID=558541 RepID=UPI00200D0817|nr:phage antirepressor KilAC domain-containing protein [Shewanella chilikensis]MCL1161507.1 Rha family transcriptional regulator [Shewanella chilikensis]
MNLITGNQLSMTSREMADLVEKRHDNVKRVIETLADQGVIEFPQIEEISTATKPVSVFIFTGERGKRDSIIVVAQLSPQFTARLVDRWQELEAKQGKPFPQIPHSFSEALQLAANQAKLLEQQAPKVEFFDRLVDRETLMNASQVAQKHKMSAIKLNKILEDLNVYSKTIKRGRVFQQWFIDNGFGQLRQTELGFSQALFTPAGEAWVCEKLISEGFAA